MSVRKARYLAEYFVFCGLVFVIRSLPVERSIQLGRFLAWMLHCVLPQKLTRRAVSEANVRVMLGADAPDAEVNGTILGMWEHLVRVVFEVVQMERRVRLYNCSDVLSFPGGELSVQAVASGRPVLFLGGHFGNWEISVNTFGDFGWPLGVVARDLDNPWLHDWFLKFRESSGNWMISKRGASTELVEAMEKQQSVSLLGDQDAGRRGVFTDFFGKPASTIKSIALLALQHDALIVVGGAWRLPRARQRESRWVSFSLMTSALIDSRDFTSKDAVPEITQAYTTALEDLIRCAPEQYFWVHRRWKSEPRQRKTRAERAAA